MTLNKPKPRISNIRITCEITAEDIQNPKFGKYIVFKGDPETPIDEQEAYILKEKQALIGVHTECPMWWSKIGGLLRPTIISRIAKNKQVIAQGDEPRSTREIVGLDPLTVQPKIKFVAKKLNEGQRIANDWLRGKI